MNEVDLGANEALRPRGIDEKPKAEKGKESLVVGATNEDEHADGMSLQIEDEVQWKRATSWGALGASCGTKSGSCEPSPRGQLQVFQRGMLEASPDLGLPAAVEALNGILKARFAWRSKDGRDAEQQAQADDLPHGAGVLTGPLENQRIVELGVVGKTELAPSSDEQFNDDGGSDELAWPTGGNTSVNRDAGEHSKLGSPSYSQAFNGVERIELAAARSDLRQVPTYRWRRSTDAPPPVQNTLAHEDAADRSPRGNQTALLGDHRGPDDIRAGVSKITLGQLTTQLQDNRFGGDARSIDGPRRTRWPAGPIDPIKTRGGGAFDPALHGSKAYTKLPGDTAQRAATTNRLHHPTTLLLDGVLCSWAVSLFPPGYQPPQPTPSTGLWNLPGYGKPAQTRRPSHSLWKTPPTHRPRFPQLPQPLLATRNKAFSSNQNQAHFHGPSDAGVLAPN